MLLSYTPTERLRMPEDHFSSFVKKFVDIVNGGDTDAFLSLFQDNGSVLDSGRRYSGFDAIKQWCDREFIGAEGKIALKVIHPPEGNSCKIEADWKSTYYSGSSEFVFIMSSDNKILELRIQG